MDSIYHIHDKICGHATNTVEAVAALCKKDGFYSLYWTEHCPLINNKFIYRPTVKEIVNLKEKIKNINAKSKDFHIYFGFEMEYNYANKQVFDDLLKLALADFVIFGNHYIGDMYKHPRLIASASLDEEDLKTYYSNTELAFKTNIFSWMAHPDIWVYGWGKWDDTAIKLCRQLIKLCEQYDMPMGFNINGYLHKGQVYFYPYEYFWKEVAKSKVKVLIEADAHNLDPLKRSSYEKVKAVALSWGLKDNLVEQVKIHWLNKTTGGQ